MLKKILKEAVFIVVGKSSEQLVDLLSGKKYINEFTLAKKMDLTINQVRNLLYKLADYDLVSSIREKDKKKGWYTYFWKIESLKCLEFLRGILIKKIDQIEHQIKSRETKKFYICERCKITMSKGGKRMRYTVILGMIVLLLFVGCSKNEENTPQPTISLQSSVSSAVVNEIIDADLGLKAVQEIAAVGVKITYNPAKIEITELNRDDSYFTSGGGTVQQMEFSVDNDNGVAKMVLAIFPSDSAVGDDSETFHRIASLQIRALSPGDASLSISIDNSADSDLGIFDRNANLVSDVDVENITLSISNSR